MPLIKSCLILLLASFSAFAEDVKVIMPEDLPGESVVPKLDSPWAVQNRKLKFEKRQELAIGQSWVLDEPFQNNTVTTVEVGMHLTNRYGLGFKFGAYSQGSNYASQFKSFAQSNGGDLKFENVPNPKYLYGLVFHDRMFYGKWSFAQDTVFPVVIDANYSAFMVDYSGKPLWSVQAGIGQKTYFGQHFGLGLQYNLMLRQTINTNSTDITENSNPQASDFSVATKISQGLDFTLQYLF